MGSVVWTPAKVPIYRSPYSRQGGKEVNLFFRNNVIHLDE